MLTNNEVKLLKMKIYEQIAAGTFTQRTFAKSVGRSRCTIQNIIADDAELQATYQNYLATKKSGIVQRPFKKREIEVIADDGDTRTITVRSLNVKTLEDALRVSKVDLKVWEVDRFKINSWEVTVGLKTSGTGRPETYTNYQVSVWLRRKSQPVQALESIYDKISKGKQIVPKYNRPRVGKTTPKRELEISLMDLHFGMICTKGTADLSYTPEIAGKLMINMLDKLLDIADLYGPFERVLLPFGNDFLHADNVIRTTTRGTPQAEAGIWEDTYEHGEQLGLAMVERCREVAPVKIISVPGNHAYHSEFTLARLIKAYYAGAKAKDVEVDVSQGPYKFHHFGVNLIGYEHGNAVRAQVRLAAVMANECRLNGWQEARYCEWHMGDQHRKGSSRPLTFEEQGVSVEYLPGLTVPNRWHRSNSFNWQKRAGMAFVWDKTAGPISRFQVNVDNYSGEIMV